MKIGEQKHRSPRMVTHAAVDIRDFIYRVVWRSTRGRSDSVALCSNEEEVLRDSSTIESTKLCAGGRRGFSKEHVKRGERTKLDVIEIP